MDGPQSESGVKKKNSKTLILVFEVIMQPPKHTIEIGFFCVLADMYIDISYHLDSAEFVTF